MNANIIFLATGIHRFILLKLQYIPGITMGRKGYRTNHVPRRPGTDSDGDILFDFEGGMILDKHSKYWKKTIKELRQRCTDDCARKTLRY